MLPASLSFRLALAYVGLFAGSVALLAGLTYWVSIRMPLTAAEDQVRREAAALADIYILDGRAALATRLEARARTPDASKAFHAFVAPDGSIVTANLPSWPMRPAAGWLRIEADIYADGDEDDHEALTLDRRFDDGARLLVGRDIEQIDENEEILRAIAAWVIGSTLALGLIGGALMSRVIGRRIEAITDAARHVMDGNLSGRVPTRGSGDDFDRLGEVLNRMLGRIEGLLESVRRVSDNVAHELRTPLTRLRATLEELSRASDDSRPSLLAEAVAEADRLETVFDAVLRIARIESGRHGAQMNPVDLSAVVRDAAELYAPAAEGKGQTFETAVAPGLTVWGDRDLLFQAVCNLIDNAVKYAPANGAVSIAAQREEGDISIVVSDNGPGIAEPDRNRVTERFYRVDTTAAAAGAGLGLSLVSAVVDQHRSSLQFDDARPGLVVKWSLPSLQDAPTPSGKAP